MKSSEASGVKEARKGLILYVLVFVLSLGLPLYFGTTTVHRADLPIDEINTLSDHLFDKIGINIPVYITSDSEAVPDSFLDRLNGNIRSELTAKHPVLNNLWSLNLKPDAPDSGSEGYRLNIKNKTGDEKFHIHADKKEIDIYSTDLASSAEIVQDILLGEVFKSEIEEVSRIVSGSGKSAHNALPHSDVTNIVFSLLVEDGKPVAWEVENVIERFDSVLKSLGHISEFQVSTQIQYYSSLTHKPLSLINDQTKYIIAEDDLSTFINYGDWNINNYDVHPTINFLIYFPTCNYENKRLLVQNSVTNSFLVPQWGGVHIFNKNFPILRREDPITITESELAPVFEIFTVQLLRLLGAPDKPHAPVINIDVLTRLTTLQNLKRSLENLKSLVKVTDSLSEISIPDQTKHYVAECITEIERAIENSNANLNEIAVEASTRALLLSDSAFFDKEMVQQAYFPSEHKLAVFLPLLGPVASIIFLSLVRLFKDWKQQRKTNKKET